jgi:hypothetical protein
MMTRAPPGVVANAIGSTAVNFHDPSHLWLSGSAGKYPARPPTVKSWCVNVAG